VCEKREPDPTSDGGIETGEAGRAGQCGEPGTPGDDGCHGCLSRRRDLREPGEDRHRETQGFQTRSATPDVLPRYDTAETISTIVASSYDCRIQYPAAALAYYGFVSLLPLLVVLLVVIGSPITDPVRSATFRFLTPEAQQAVSRGLADATGKLGATLFAIVVLVWSALNVVAGFETVIGRVEDPSGESLVGHLRDAVSILGSLGLGIGSVVVASALFALLPGASHVVAGGLVFLFVALTVVFLPLYYVPTNEIPTLTSALPGTLTVAVGWTVLLAAVRFYVANAATYAVYGVLSGILLVLTSLYVAAVVLMLGFVVNATLADGAAVTGSPQ
jgi:membrane protein